MKQSSASSLVFFGIVIALIAGVGGLLYANKNKNSGIAGAYSSSTLSSSESSYDFGTVSMAKGNVSRMFSLKNEGQEPVAITKVYTSCMCTTASLIDAAGARKGYFGMPGHGGGSSGANAVIQPGETMQVEAVFDPAAHGPSGVGLAQRSIYIETNSRTKPKVEFSFTANVTP
ncbi:MAG: DUF1573 domain-containing protein [Candidatus Wildermuthbacteria bacterium]|nr:DUF1573 domain-containing protein [Candidatus Wildermuthbacteria bacterium]